MSSSSERAAELRRQADALDSMAELEQSLLAAKESGDKAAIREASEVLRGARSQTRTEGTTVGGDAYVMTDGEG